MYILSQINLQSTPDYSNLQNCFGYPKPQIYRIFSPEEKKLAHESEEWMHGFKQISRIIVLYCGVANANDLLSDFCQQIRI